MDAEEQEQTVIRGLKEENQRLRQRVFELEEKTRGINKGGTEGPGPESSVMRLLEKKDIKLEEFAAELGEKTVQLESAIQGLRKRNEELSLWMVMLRLYAEIFEHDDSAMIGVNRDGKVVLYNKAAPSVLGEKIKSALHHEIESVDFTGFDPTTPRLVRDALAHRRQAQNLVRVQGRRITTSVYPMGSGAELTGALVKIMVTPDN